MTSPASAAWSRLIVCVYVPASTTMVSASGVARSRVIASLIRLHFAVAVHRVELPAPSST